MIPLFRCSTPVMTAAAIPVVSVSAMMATVALAQAKSDAGLAVTVVVTTVDAAVRRMAVTIPA